MTFARAKFWICINIYALLLDVLGCTTFVMAIVLLRTWLVATILCCFAAIFILYGGIGIHSTYTEKCRIYSILIRRNSNGVKVETFKDFLSVPCHRVVVRMVLHQLHQSAKYSEIKEKYYKPPWERRFPEETVYRVFKTKEEGEQWFLQRKREIA